MKTPSAHCNTVYDENSFSRSLKFFYSNRSSKHCLHNRSTADTTHNLNLCSRPGCCNLAYSCFFFNFSYLHATTLIVYYFFSCTVVIFASSYRVLFCVDGAEIKDITATTTTSTLANVGSPYFGADEFCKNFPMLFAALLFSSSSLRRPCLLLLGLK